MAIVRGAGVGQGYTAPGANTFGRQRRALLPIAVLLLTSGPALAQSFTGAGSTFVHPLIARWGQRFASLEGDIGGAVTIDGGLDYEPVSSLGGVTRAAASTGKLGVSSPAVTPKLKCSIPNRFSRDPPRN
jgi:ABC-type phosphate transport system substrate-binding protein